MSRIYVASSWRNPLQPRVVALLRVVGHEVYDFRNPTYCQTGFGWRECDDQPAQEWTADKTREILQTHPACARGFNSDFRAMRWADTCVLLMPSGRSAHIEAGWFSGANKRLVVMLAEGCEPELMHLLADTLVVNEAELCRQFADNPTPGQVAGWLEMAGALARAAA